MSWLALSGRLPNRHSPRLPEGQRLITEDTARRVAIPSQHTPNAEQGWGHGHGQENPRGYYQPDIIRRWKLDRGSSATYHRSGGNQPAHQSMINRRFMIAPPALPSGGHTEQLEGTDIACRRCGGRLHARSRSSRSRTQELLDLDQACGTDAKLPEGPTLKPCKKAR